MAEFQGQTMNSTDLATFFMNEVPKARTGDDGASLIRVATLLP